MTKEHSPTLAVIFSILLPGLGQFYNQEILKALCFLCGLILLSFFYSPLGLLAIAIASIESFLKARQLRETGFISKNKKISIYILIIFYIFGFLAGFFGSSLINLFE